MNPEPSSPRRSPNRSRTLLQSALIALVAERSLPEISVSDVARHAHVGRSTFYEHFTDVHDLAAAACLSMFDELIGTVPVFVPGGSLQHKIRARQGLAQILAGIGARARLYRAFVGPEGSAKAIDGLRRRLTAAVQAGLGTAAGQPPASLAAAGIAGHILAVVADWLDEGCPQEPEALASALWPQLSAMAQAQSRGAGPRPGGARDARHAAFPDRSVLTDRLSTVREISRSGIPMREQILEVSLRLFGAHGFRGTSLQDIAKDVGCSKGTVLYHFGDKEAILAQLLRPVQQLLDAVLAELAGVPDEEVAEAAVLGFVEVAVRFRREIGLLMSDVPEEVKGLDWSDDTAVNWLLEALTGRSGVPREEFRALMAIGAVIVAAAGPRELPPEEMREEMVEGALRVLGRHPEG